MKSSKGQEQGQPRLKREIQTKHLQELLRLQKIGVVYLNFLILNAEIVEMCIFVSA